MPSLSERVTNCPYCGQTITLLVDASAGSQQYIEDCSVCCRPIQVSVTVDGGDITGLDVQTDH